VCDAAARIGLTDPALMLCLADAHLQAGNASEAIRVTDDLLQRNPEHLGGLCTKAKALIATGLSAQAREPLLRVIDRYPDYRGALDTLARLAMPGPGYREVLAALHRLLQPATYLEIGVETGETLALASAARVAVGIEPRPEKIVATLPSNAR